MQVTVYTDGQKWLDTVRGFLLANEVANALPFGIGKRIAASAEPAKSEPFMAAVTDGNTVTGAAIMTPPHGVILTRGTAPEAWPLIIEALRAGDWPVPALIGPLEEAEAFAAAWQAATGQAQHIIYRQRVYQLARVIPPARPTPGQMRLATDEDVAQIAAWITAFQAEATADPPRSSAEQVPVVQKRAAAQELFVWEVDGQIVSMAGKSRPTPQTITVNCVYTPPEQRRRGYATALVAAQSQHLLDSGYRYCTLFTDLDNSTANAIYMQIGYEPVCDFRMLEFEA